MGFKRIRSHFLHRDLHVPFNKDSIEEDLLFPQGCRIILQMAFTRPVPDHEMPLVRR